MFDFNSVRLSSVLKINSYPKLLTLHDHLEHIHRTSDVENCDIEAFKKIFDATHKNADGSITIREEIIFFLRDIISISGFDLVNEKDSKKKTQFKKSMLDWVMKVLFNNCDPIISTCCTVSEALKNEIFSKIKLGTVQPTKASKRGKSLKETIEVSKKRKIDSEESLVIEPEVSDNVTPTIEIENSLKQSVNESLAEETKIVDKNNESEINEVEEKLMNEVDKDVGEIEVAKFE